MTFENWLALVSIAATDPPQLNSSFFSADVTAAVWKTLSGGSALQVIEAPDHPWVIAVEGSDPNNVRSALSRILELVSTTAAGKPEMFEEIFRHDNATNIAGDDREVFYARVRAREAALDALNHWYNFVHLPEVNDAGLLGGRRFQSADAERTYLALYRPETVDVLRSDAISAVRGFGDFANDIEEFSRMEARTVAWCSGNA